MLKEYLKSINEKPQEHYLLFGAVVSILFGLCSWQYCKGYFSALGIDISFSHIDNLIFVFNQFINVSVSTTWSYWEHSFWIHMFGIGFVASILILSTLYSRYGHHLKSRPEADLKADSSFVYWSALLYWIFFALTALSIMNIVASSHLTKLVIGICIVCSGIKLGREIWRKDVDKKAHHILWGLAAFLLVFNSFRKIGELDGELVYKDQYRRLDTICLSSPAPELNGGDTVFNVCGKLVFSDSSRLCIKEKEASYPICRKRDLYETTIIPSNF